MRQANVQSVFYVEARHEESEMVIESERPATRATGRHGLGSGHKVYGKFRSSSDTSVATFEGHLLSQGEETESNEANLRTDHQIRAIERSADSVARSAGHDFASKFVSVKGHVWPQ